MSTPTLRPAPTQPGLSENDRIAHDMTMPVRAPLPVAPVDRAVARFEILSATVDRLLRVDVRDMSPTQFDLLAGAQQELAAVRSQLVEAGALHRVELGVSS